MEKCTPTPTVADNFGWIPLHYAAHLGDVELVELLLENDKSLAYVTDEEGMSALHISAKKGHVGVMRAIITRCPDTCELLDKSSRTALHLAVESGKVGPVKFLLQVSEFQNLINEQDIEGNTPLHLAATRGYIIIVRLMSKFRKVDTEIMNKADMTTLEKFRSVAQQHLASWMINEVSYVYLTIELYKFYKTIIINVSNHLVSSDIYEIKKKLINYLRDIIH